MRKYTLIISFYIVLLPISILAGGWPGHAEAAPSGPATYFSSGQSVYDPQDNAKSHLQAVQDFMVQGLTQAIGSFLSPSQMGAQFAEIQKDVLAKPEKYVNSYQVFSEEQTGAIVHVVGQVTVSMEPLKEDLLKSGILALQQKPQAQSDPQPGIGAPAEANQSANKQEEAGEGPSGAADEPRPPAQLKQTTSGPPVNEGAPGKAISRGISSTKREILWAVSEKWEQEWVLPTDSGDVRSLFARSFGRQMDDLDFSILLPQPGSVRMDLGGNVPASQVISLAEGLGIQDVVVGKVSYTEDRNSNQVLLDAGLRVIRIGQGKSEFELHRTQNMEDMSNQEGAIELARRIAPQLSSLLGGAQTAGAHKSGEGGTASGQGETSAQPENAGPLLIYVPSTQYSYWMELESMLRQQFKNLQRTGLEIGATQSAVKLDGVGGGYILKMSGTRLPSGAMILIDSYSTESKTMKVSFTPPEKVQAEPK